MTTNELQISKDFLKQNSRYAKIKRPAKKGGPYSKIDKDARRDEVYRLYFDYGYSARKIAELMKIHRNTINGDVQFWYSKISRNIHIINPETSIILQLKKMEIQQIRLRECLDKVKSHSEQITIERLIFDINSKIMHTVQKLADSKIRNQERAAEWLNNQMSKNNWPERTLTYFDTISVSPKSYERIRRIINEDRQLGNQIKRY